MVVMCIWTGLYPGLLIILFFSGAAVTGTQDLYMTEGLNHTQYFIKPLFHDAVGANWQAEQKQTEGNVYYLPFMLV